MNRAKDSIMLLLLQTFLEVQKLGCKTNGRVVSDVMTSTPLTVDETTSLEDATRLMLETKYARVPVVDGNGLLVGIITREDIVRAACQIKAMGKKLP
uniref:CBS domain-containing protein n=1 Tax=Kalanchoe fedtschenkoi TaxID=63787 RepID=A0A7N0SZ99_KALFE